jgi:anti-anti-sigma factor
MIRLKCLDCGLTTPYKGSKGEYCPRCLAREQKAVRLITFSDEVSPLVRGSMGRLSVLTRTEHGRHTILLRGELDIASAQMLDATLVDACNEGAQEVVIDMAGIEFMDSSGLNAILRGRKLCEQRGCSFELTPAQRPVQRVLQATNVLKRLPFRKAGGREEQPGSAAPRV